jgi:hypothetical protein
VSVLSLLGQSAATADEPVAALSHDQHQAQPDWRTQATPATLADVMDGMRFRECCRFLARA